MNCVRFQFLDLTTKQGVLTTYTWAGLIDVNRDDTRVFDKEQLDQLGYLIQVIRQ